VYTKILVALDGSDSSKRALHRAVVLAEKFGSKLTLLTVFHRRVLLPLVEEGGRWRWMMRSTRATGTL
jgi:nucleotide-binding universal stress UspA family protein